MATKKPSLKNQIEHALRTIFRPGVSRHEAKATGTAHKYIYSYKTLDRYRAACLALVRILPPDERPKFLSDLTTPHLARGIALLQERGNQDKTIKTQLGAWRKLGYALNALGWSDRDPHDLVPQSFYTDLEDSRPQGPVSPGQVTDWRAAVTDHATRSRRYGNDLVLLFNLCHATGMRIEEATRLQEHMIDRAGAVIHISANIAKNGRARDVPLDTEAARAAVAAIPSGRHWLWLDGPALARRLQDVMRAAAADLGIDGKRGPHRLRAAYAEDFLLRRLHDGLTEDAARRELSARVGHKRIQVTYKYVPKLGR